MAPSASGSPWVSAVSLAHRRWNGSADDGKSIRWLAAGDGVLVRLTIDRDLMDEEGEEDVVEESRRSAERRREILMQCISWGLVRIW